MSTITDVAAVIAMAAMTTASAVVALVDEVKQGVVLLRDILRVLEELVRLHPKPLNYQSIVPDRPSFTRPSQQGEKRRSKSDVNGQRYGRFGEPIGAVHGPETVMPAGVLDHAKV